MAHQTRASHESQDCCPNCVNPSVPFDLKKPQKIIEHLSAHALHDPAALGSEICGLCLHPSPICRFYLSKTSGRKTNLRINMITSECQRLIKFNYTSAAESKERSPCSNVLIMCPFCLAKAPAMWRYSMKQHILNTHPHVRLEDHRNLWELSRFEIVKMKEVWKLIEGWAKVSRRSRGRPKKKIDGMGGLVILEAHSSALSFHE